MIQSVLFDTSIWTTKRAKYYLDTHDFVPIKRVHRTEKYLRYRLLDPKEFKKFKTITVGNGVLYIIGY